MKNSITNRYNKLPDYSSILEDLNNSEEFNSLPEDYRAFFLELFQDESEGMEIDHLVDNLAHRIFIRTMSNSIEINTLEDFKISITFFKILVNIFQDKKMLDSMDIIESIIAVRHWVEAAGRKKKLSENTIDMLLEDLREISHELSQPKKININEDIKKSISDLSLETFHNYFFTKADSTLIRDKSEVVVEEDYSTVSFEIYDLYPNPPLDEDTINLIKNLTQNPDIVVATDGNYRPGMPTWRTYVLTNNGKLYGFWKSGVLYGDHKLGGIDERFTLLTSDPVEAKNIFDIIDKAPLLSPIGDIHKKVKTFLALNSA